MCRFTDMPRLAYFGFLSFVTSQYWRWFVVSGYLILVTKLFYCDCHGWNKGLKLRLNQGVKIIKKRATFCSNSLTFSGATRNRTIHSSGWISLMYLLAKEVISRYCSTGFLQYFAVSCGVDFLLLYKGNALFWNTSRCLVFLLHQQFFRLPQSNNTMIIRLRHINMYMYGTNNYWKWHSEYPKCNVWISEMELLEFFGWYSRYSDSSSKLYIRVEY